MARNSLNKVTLIGNLAADPQTRATGNGLTVCNFTVMTNEGYKDASGNWVDRAEAHRIVVFDKLADICAKYLVKGKKVYVEGSLQTRSYDDKDGIKRYTTEIKASDMIMLSRDESQGGGNYDGGSSNYGDRYNRPQAASAPTRQAAPTSNDDFGPEDDLPF